MPNSLFQYEMLPTTWFYISSLMILAIFFRFNRVWSVRNLDILGLILFTPGLLLISMGYYQTGYSWLMSLGVIMFFRLLLDPFMVRRPLLNPNLTSAGLIFASVLSVSFLVANVLVNHGSHLESFRTLRLEQILSLQAKLKEGETPSYFQRPGYRPFLKLTKVANEIFTPAPSLLKTLNSRQTALFWGGKSPIGGGAVPASSRLFEVGPFGNDSQSPAQQVFQKEQTNNASLDYWEGAAPLSSESAENSTIVSNQSSQSLSVPQNLLNGEETVKYSGKDNFFKSGSSDSLTDSSVTTSLSADQKILIFWILMIEVGIVVTIVLIGHCHFCNILTGIAAAMVYLLLPYVNQMTCCLDHILPAFLILLAIGFYRRPVVSGLFLGLAGALAFYPFFLLPLWGSFYRAKGFPRFVLGACSAILLMMLLLLFSPPELGSYAEQVATMFGYYSLRVPTPDGFWEFVPTYYRIPIIALYLVFCFGFILWPSRKDLATLISGSALLMLGVQLWQGNQGGLSMAWYLPLVILTIFRPNLEDRVASAMVVDI